jgi:chaperone LolA
LAAAVLCGTAAAQPPSNDQADGFATVESFLAKVHSLTADFRQQILDADESVIQTDTGTLAFERPNRFRWVSRKPTEFVVVADGKKIWMYDVELASVTVSPLDELDASSPALLLSGDRSVRDGFDVVGTSNVDGLKWVELAPKSSGGGFSSVRIGFAGNTPQRLELVDSLNETTKIELDKIVVNPDIPKSDFEFKPPAGVEVTGGQG